MKDLRKELDEKIHHLFRENQAYLDYLLQTKNNFLFRYLETDNDKNIKIENINEQTLLASSFEYNMGEAFKISNPQIKEGIKALAKSVPPSDKPKIRYSLKTEILELSGDRGKIKIVAQVNWGFPSFDNILELKEKSVLFEFSDTNIFRKELALKFEEACEIFV